jgi:hypothetical protein
LNINGEHTHQGKILIFQDSSDFKCKIMKGLERRVEVVVVVVAVTVIVVVVVAAASAAVVVTLKQKR